MPDERPTNPSPNWMVEELRTPNQTDGFFTALVERASDNYQKVWPIKRGQPYASILGSDQRVIDRYAANPLYFLKELRPGNTSSSDFGSTSDWVIWVWANQKLAQDTYNSEVTYEEDGTAFPVFVREYDIRRKVWEANQTIATSSALTGLLSVAITAAGTGYTYATGTAATGATCEAVIFNGAIIDWVVTKEGSGVTGGAAITITGDGTGATATCRIQPASAVLIQQTKRELSEDDPRSHDYVRIIRTYATMPGPILVSGFLSEDVRGRVIEEDVQKGLTGTLGIESGDLIISSEVQPISSVVDQRTTRKIAALPPNEVWAYWDEISLPLLVFDIINTVFCNATSLISLVTNYTTDMGSTNMRKHRKTVGYVSTAPDATPDLSTSSYTTADLRYAGKIININLSNVLNDDLSESIDVYQSDAMDACFWTEAYDFPATVPSATDFAAGMWITKSFDVVPFGQSMFKFIKIEYWSAQGNPSI